MESGGGKETMCYNIVYSPVIVCAPPMTSE